MGLGSFEYKIKELLSERNIESKYIMNKHQISILPLYAELYDRLWPDEEIRIGT